MDLWFLYRVGYYDDMEEDRKNSYKVEEGIVRAYGMSEALHNIEVWYGKDSIEDVRIKDVFGESQACSVMTKKMLDEVDWNF